MKKKIMLYSEINKYEADSKLKIWCNNIEESAMEQINNMVEHPCIHRVAIMPDAHSGFGCPIGSVALTMDCIIPNVVGVDIGCSMSAVKTNINIDTIDNNKLYTIYEMMKEEIPVGFKHREKITDEIKQRMFLFGTNTKIVLDEITNNNALNQLGTLGGGNHFISIDKDKDNMLWIVIHSGSRNLGKKVCEYYDNIAKENCTKYKQNKVVKDDLAFIPYGTELFNDYVNEMKACMVFAEENHYQMMERIKNILSNTLNAEFIENIYTMHNFCSLENHFGKNYWVHRKGAIKAKGKVIIPGNQKDGTYICEGLENKFSYCSASHGAGRVMSRALAKKTLDLETVQKNMSGIIHNITSIEQLDEAAEAYKNLDEVLEMEKDLVTPVNKLTPLAVLKG